MFHNISSSAFHLLWAIFSAIGFKEKNADLEEIESRFDRNI